MCRRVQPAPGHAAVLSESQCNLSSVITADMQALASGTCRCVGRSAILHAQHHRSHQPSRQQAALPCRQRSIHRQVSCAAEPDKETQPPEEELAERLSEVTSKKLAPGQATAIVTGAVSIIIGIAYLALTFWLDQRGGVMQPPPPEAFGQ